MVYNSHLKIMKKLLFSLVALVAMSFTFVACEDNTGTGTGTNQTVKSNCSPYDAQYYVDESGAIYLFEFLTEGLEVSGQNIFGSGDDVILMVYAQPQKDGYPTAKTYEVIPFEEITEEDTECVVGGYVYQSNVIGSYAYVVEDGEAVDGLLCIGGSIKFEGNATNGTMTANLEFMDTKGNTVEREYIYSGKLNIEQYVDEAPARAPKMR